MEAELLQRRDDWNDVEDEINLEHFDNDDAQDKSINLNNDENIVYVEK